MQDQSSICTQTVRNEGRTFMMLEQYIIELLNSDWSEGVD